MNTSHRPSLYKKVGNAAVALAILLIVIGGGGYFLYNSFASGESDEAIRWKFTKPRVGEFEHVIIEKGDVESAENIEVRCEVRAKGSAGTRIISVIEEGVRVKKGELLVELDASALEDERDRQKIAVNQAKSRVISAESLLQQQEIAKEEYLKGTYFTNKQVAEGNILIAEETINQAREKYNFSIRLAAQGFLTDTQLKTDEFAVKRSQLELDLRLTELSTLEDITKKKMLVGFDSDIKSAQVSVETERENLIEEEETFQEIEAQIEKCVINAPADGLVIHANERGSRGGSEFRVEAGATVRERQAIIFLPNVDKMRVRVKVNEGNVSFVSDGGGEIEQAQTAEIRLSGIEEPLRGKVTKVNRYPDPSNWFEGNVKRFSTFITLLDAPPSVRSGLTAEVSIFADRELGATQLPVTVLHDDSGDRFCLVKVTADRDDPLHTLAGIFKEGEDYKSVELRRVHFSKSNEQFVVIEEMPSEITANAPLPEEELLTADDFVVQNPRSYEQDVDADESKLYLLVLDYRVRDIMRRVGGDAEKPITIANIDMNIYAEFISYNADNDLVLDKEEVKTFVSETGNYLPPQKVVTFTEEETAAIKESTKTSEKEDELTPFREQAKQFIGFIMQRVDTNSDGVIDSDEIAASDDPARMKEADANKDGEITKDEMIESMAKAIQARQAGENADSADDADETESESE
ncbi:MAG: hypothetical protein ACJZ8O_11450 [Pirellulaceae bacterium]